MVSVGFYRSSTKRPWKHAPIDSLRLKVAGRGSDGKVFTERELRCDDITSAGRPFRVEFMPRGLILMEAPSCAYHEGGRLDV